MVMRDERRRLNRPTARKDYDRAAPRHPQTSYQTARPGECTKLADPSYDEKHGCPQTDFSTASFGVISMRVIQFSAVHAEPVTLFDSAAASSRLVADGRGEVHVHFLRLEAGGKIGEHPAGFGQLFLVVEGSGWAAGADGRRVEVHAGQGVYFERGERHSKGSDRGMTVLMVQVTDLQLPALVVDESGQ